MLLRHSSYQEELSVRLISRPLPTGRSTLDIRVHRINKTSLSYRTDSIIGGVGPSEYLARLEAGDKCRPQIRTSMHT